MGLRKFDICIHRKNVEKEVGVELELERKTVV